MIYKQYERLLEDPAVLDQFEVYLKEKQVIAILEYLHQVGSHHVDYTPEEFVVLWNNRQDPRFRFKASIWAEGRWLDQTHAAVDQGEVPSFLVIIPSREAADMESKPPKILNIKWDIRVDYLDQVSLVHRSLGDSEIAM